MRGTVDDLRSPLPLFDRLPGVYASDTLARQLLSALDTVVAPVLLTLDCLEAYVDPQLAPPDFLPWLASWVGLLADERWDDAQVRAMIGIAVSLYRIRGTTEGVRALARTFTGSDAVVTDSGGVRSAGGGDDWSARQWVRVEARWSAYASDDPARRARDEARLRELLLRSIPASVELVLDVRDDGADAANGAPGGAPDDDEVA